MKKKTALFFIRYNCFYSRLMIKFLRNKLSIKVIYSKNRRQKISKNLLKWKGDYIFCFRSYFILPKFLINQAKIAAINFHPAPPSSSGSGGINRALYNNEKNFGTTAHLMNEKIDNGKIIKVRYFSILRIDNVSSLLKKAHKNTYILFKQVLKKILREGKLYIDNQVHSCKKKGINWTDKTRKISEINRMQVIKATYSKKKVEKIIRAAHLENYPVYIKFHNYKFFLNLNEKK
jgi:methionyl-tRNA formyltransferase